MRSLLALLGVLFCLWCMAFPGCAFLKVSETPGPVDVVVQFVGPDNIARSAKAAGLVRQGLAPLLMIPGQRSLFAPNRQGELAPLRTAETAAAFWCRSWGSPLSSRMMENTHKELLLARCAMDHLRLHSAILVSSPCHMRRIRLMAKRVFDQQHYRILYVAAETDQGGQPWWPTRNDWWWLMREYPKIVWFFLYEPFLRDRTA